MQVDNPLQPNFSFASNLEDYLNTDFFGGPSNSTYSRGSSPRSSPSNTFVALPSTPPTSFPDTSMNVSSYFNFPLDDDFAKLDHLSQPLPSSGHFDFLSALSAAGAAHMSSPESASGSGSGDSSSMSATDSPAGIDPQLVGTPSQAKDMSEFGDNEGLDEDDEALDAELAGESASPMSEQDVAPVKVGGRGKAAGRKGTVQSGGVVKRAGGEKKENRPATMMSTTSMEADDWRPSPEEYKKMSSKEKRQLRNKISARNFRVRRKEYITTLEGDIAERDRLIDAIRTELGSTKSENHALRQEIAGLKKALLDGRGRSDTPVLPPPAPLPTIPASLLASGSSNSNAQAQKGPLVTPNTQKDLPTSPRLGARGFWGGAASFGGITPVHTTLVPEWGSVLSGKPFTANNARPAERRSPALQENINPVLNGVTASSWAGMMGVQASQEKSNQATNANIGQFESFMDVNPFTLKTLDPYRMQLWRDMAYQQRRTAQQPQASSSANTSPSSSPGSSPNGLAGSLRPSYFKSSPTLSALLAGKSSASSYPTPPSSLPLSSAIKHASTSTSTPTPQQAMLASIASETLANRLGSAFWDAFARPAATGLRTGPALREWDAEKVRKVIEGSAVVRIVDVESHPQPQPVPAPPAPVKERKAHHHICPGHHVADILEESMRSLSISKK